jgi:hypothetical protein
LSLDGRDGDDTRCAGHRDSEEANWLLRMAMPRKSKNKLQVEQHSRFHKALLESFSSSEVCTHAPWHTTSAFAYTFSLSSSRCRDGMDGHRQARSFPAKKYLFQDADRFLRYWIDCNTASAKVHGCLSASFVLYKNAGNTSHAPSCRPPIL